MEPHLEDVYEALARAIDAAGRDKETLLLAKVALLFAQRLDDLELGREVTLFLGDLQSLLEQPARCDIRILRRRRRAGGPAVAAAAVTACGCRRRGRRRGCQRVAETDASGI